MIGRGLQILIVVITALGAAPLYGQAGTTVHPTYVVLQDMGRAELNGLYVAIGELSNANGIVFQRYTTDGQTPQWWVMVGDATSNNNMFLHVRNEYPTDYGGTLEYQFVLSTDGTFPASKTGTFQGLNGTPNTTGTAILNWALPPVDPYEEVFPDWESAGVLIPLGFGFGMMFWASALALHVPMKWVRSLADAAS